MWIKRIREIKSCVPKGLGWCSSCDTVPGTGFQLLIAIEPLSLVQETLQKKWAGILDGLKLLWAHRQKDGPLLAELVARFEFGFLIAKVVFSEGLQKCNMFRVALLTEQPYKPWFNTVPSNTGREWQYLYNIINDVCSKKKCRSIKQTKYFIQYLKKLQFRNNKYNFKYCHNITCYLIMMIQNGWLNIFENFRWFQVTNFKYVVVPISWSNSIRQCPVEALEKLIMPIIPICLCLKYNKYFKT